MSLGPPAARAASIASRASRTARSPSAWKWHWKPSASSSVTYSGSRAGSMKLVPRLAVTRAAPVQIRVEQRGRVVLGDAVQHQLHRARPEPSPAQRGALLDEFGNLSGTALPVPPQGTHDPGGERAVPRGGEIRLGRIVHAEEVAHQRVLPGGDAERVQMPLGVQQRRQPVGRRGGRGQPADELHRALLKGAGGYAGGVPLDAPVGRVGRVRADAGQLQRPAVHPGTVVVPVGQVHRPVRDDRVQQLLRRRAPRERLHRPAAAEDPLPLRMRVGVGPHGGHGRLRRRRAGQIAPGQFEPGRHRVDVRVLEAGQQQPPREVDHLRTGPGEFAQPGVTDGGDPVAGDGHGGRRTALGDEDGAAGEEEISVHDAFPDRSVGGGPGRVRTTGGVLVGSPRPVTRTRLERLRARTGGPRPH